MFTYGAARLPPHAPAAQMQFVRARRLFETELMVGAPLEKSARFRDRAIDPASATSDGQGSVDPHRATRLAAPSISPPCFGVTANLQRRLRLLRLGRAQGPEEQATISIPRAPASRVGGLGKPRGWAVPPDSLAGSSPSVWMQVPLPGAAP